MTDPAKIKELANSIAEVEVILSQLDAISKGATMAKITVFAGYTAHDYTLPTERVLPLLENRFYQLRNELDSAGVTDKRWGFVDPQLRKVTAQSGG